MSKNHSLLVAIILCCVSFISCDDDNVDVPNINDYLKYHPVTMGHWIEYQVDSTIYDNFLDETLYSSTNRREEIIEQFEDNEGRTSYTVAMYEQKDAEGNWNTTDAEVYYFTVADQRIERVIDNLRFIPFVFPLENGVKWQGNSFINTDEFPEYDNWQYEYKDIGLPKAISNQQFANTVTVLQNDYSNVLERLYGEEIFAENIGLVYKRIELLKLLASELPPLEEVPWPDRANTGIIVEYNVTDYKQ